MDNFKFFKFPWDLLGFTFKVNNSVLGANLLPADLDVSSLTFVYSSISWDHDIHK